MHFQKTGFSGGWLIEPELVEDQRGFFARTFCAREFTERGLVATFVQHAERMLIIWALNRERGIKLRAAKALGINRVTLDRKLLEYTIHVKRGKGVVDAAEAEPEEEIETGH